MHCLIFKGLFRGGVPADRSRRFTSEVVAIKKVAREGIGKNRVAMAAPQRCRFVFPSLCSRSGSVLCARPKCDLVPPRLSQAASLERLCVVAAFSATLLNVAMITVAEHCRSVHAHVSTAPPRVAAGVGAAQDGVVMGRVTRVAGAGVRRVVRVGTGPACSVASLCLHRDEAN